jgi:hypothetical protein
MLFKDLYGILSSQGTIRADWYIPGFQIDDGLHAQIYQPSCIQRLLLQRRFLLNANCKTLESHVNHTSVNLSCALVRPSKQLVLALAKHALSEFVLCSGPAE